MINELYLLLLYYIFLFGKDICLRITSRGDSEKVAWVSYFAVKLVHEERKYKWYKIAYSNCLISFLAICCIDQTIF